MSLSAWLISYFALMICGVWIVRFRGKSMLKYLISTLSVCSFVFSFMTSINVATAGKIMDQISGYIEITKDFDIQRLTLPSQNLKEILNKDADYLIYSYDISPDGKERILSVGGTEIKPDRLVMLTKAKKFVTLVSRDFVRCPSFSPDGRSIAYLYHKYERNNMHWFDDYYLYQVNSDGSSDRQICDLSCMQAKPSWFPDGKRLIVGSKDLSIYIVDVKTGKKIKIITFGTMPTVSHDGKKIAYLSKEIEESLKHEMIAFKKLTRKEYEETYMKEKDKRKELEFSKLFFHYSIYIYDVDTGQSKKLTRELSIEKPVIWSTDDKYLLYNDEKWMGNDVYVLDIETGDKEKIVNLHGQIMGWR